MKKLLKQLLAVTTAIMMAITLLPAMANAEEVEPTAPTTTIDYNGNGRLTINKTTGRGTDGKTKPLPGAEFTVYKIASLDEANGYQMLVTTDKYQTPESLLNLDADEQMAAAVAFKKVVSNNTTHIAKYGADDGRKPAKQETDQDGKAVFDNLDLGYYLVVETKTPIVQENGKDTIQYVASTPFFVAIPQSDQTTAYGEEATKATTAWKYDVVATPKNEKVSIDKKIVENGANKDKDTVAVGDTINYEITSTSPKYTKEYFIDGGAEKNPTYNIHDTLSDGLTLNADTIKVTVDDGTVNGTELRLTTDYTLTTEAHKFDIVFTSDFLKKEEYKGATVKVNYSVTVNENAVVGTDGNTNDVSLDYSRKPDELTEGVPGKTTPTVYTYALSTSTNKGLAGAKFQLYKKGTEKPIAGLKNMVTKDGNENGVKDTLVTLEDGVIEFSGLNVGTYVLREIEAPKGYTLNKDEIEFTIGDEDTDGKLDSVAEGSKVTNVTTEDGKNTGMVETTITNNKGFNLPSTGGMGTYIFTIGGLVVMAGAVLLLVSSKKKRA